MTLVHYDGILRRLGAMAGNDFCTVIDLLHPWFQVRCD
jgi:hypothetical protein